MGLYEDLWMMQGCAKKVFDEQPKSRYTGSLKSLKLGRASAEPVPPTPLSVTETLEATMAPLVEPLSEREIDVLRLMAAGFSNQEIANKLVISVSLIKNIG